MTSPKEQFDDLANVLDQYESELENVKERLRVRGKTLGDALQEQSEWVRFYGIKLAELNKLMKYAESRTEATRGRLFKQYTESCNRELSDRAKDKYIDNEALYLNNYHIYLEIKEMYEKYAAVVDALKARGYSLKNIIESRVNGIELLTL